MEEGPGSILHSTEKRKLQNLLFSELFCGLCFECSEGISINFQLEIVTVGWSYFVELGDVYTSVFNKSSEDLASKIICNNCTDQLIQSYKFIQNSKLTSKLLDGYIKDLDSKTEELVTYFKDTELMSTICIVLENNKGTETDSMTSWRTKMCEENNKIASLPKNERRRELRIQGSLSHKQFIAHPETKSHTVNPKRFKLTHIGQTEKLKLNHADQSEKSKLTYSVKVERIQCVMCLEDIKDSQHSCEFKCPECIDPLCKHFSYLIHYREQLLQNIVAKCRDCNFLCRNKDSLIDHVNKHHIDQHPYTCDLCGQTYQSKSAIQTHISQCHIKDRTEPLKKNANKLLKLNGPNVLHAHSPKHGGRFLACHVCGKLVTEEIYKKHVENHGVMSCSKCDKSFAKISLLKYHQQSHLDDVTCPTCKKSINPSNLKQHLKSHTGDSQITVKKSKANVTCELCDYITWNSILLECHMNRHHLKVKPYVCHICSKDFVGKHLLKKHIKFHTADRSVICAVCGKTLANSDCLKIHLRLHTGERNYPCDICGKRFRSASIRNVHKVKKHCEREAACPLCPSKFYTLVELRSHVIKIHWKKNTKFDPRQLEGLENHYHLFHDGRRIRMGDQDIDFYMPC